MSDVTSDRRGFAHRAGMVLALVLVGFWVYGLVQSVRQDRLYLGDWTWTFANPTLADDFHYHIDHTARVLAAGGSIESETDIFCRLFPYPLMIPRMFRWVAWMGPRAAVAVWTGALALIFVAGAGAASRSRARLGLTPLPFPWMLVLVLYATPMLSAIERGQCDPLTVLFLVGASALLRSERRPGLAETASGGLLGLAAWIKFYPGLVIVPLVALRKWRAALAFLVVAGSIGVMDFSTTLRAIGNGREIAESNTTSVTWLSPVQHAVSTFWPHFWGSTPLRGLSKLPGPAVSVLLLGPMLAVVCGRCWRLGPRVAGAVALPLLLWVVAMGTFALPYSNDYNLIFLPLAVLAVFDRGDPVWVSMALGLLALSWQPVGCMVEPRVLFVGKLLALYGVGWCVRNRVIEVGRSLDEGRKAVPAPHVSARPVLSSFPTDRGGA
jgi:hypothetical protein